MRELTTIPKSMQAAVTSRLKIMGELDIAERRTPQDGRISIRFGGAADGPAHRGAPDDARRADRPPHPATRRGSRSVSRARDGPDAEATFARAIDQPYGAVIAVGPTGSGKTTTLYAALDVLNEPTAC